MKSVTYRGAADPSDRTSRYITEHEDKRVVLAKGVAVEVPDALARELEATDGHTFEIEGVKRSNSKKSDDQADAAATTEG